MQKKVLRVKIILIAFTLILLGIIMVYSTTSISSWQIKGDSEFYFKRQLLYFFIGFILSGFALLLDLDFLRRYSKVLILIGLVSLICVFLPHIGRQAGGAKRWLSLKGFNIQPSEFCKLFLILYYADYLCRKKNKIKDFKEGILAPLLITALYSFLIILEPDFGQAIFVFLIFLFMFYIGRAKFKHLLFIVLVGLIFFLIFSFSSQYRAKRLLVFLNPWKDPKGAGYQLVQAHLALGRGGLLGKGLGKSIHKLYYLPAAHTDFIFAIIGEELGFLGCFSVIFLYLLFFFYSLKLIKFIKDEFSYYLAWGCVLNLILQAQINMGVVLGVLPTKGLPLPFVSYGGSSLICSMLSLGLFLNASKN